MRSIPDVSLNSDPHTGYPIYATQNNVASWMSAGGTSIATPIWAAIEANSVKGFNIDKIYADAKSVPAVFRDITTGNNGTCGALCNAVAGYDFTTGLGVPATYKY
jgi:subtilase family serine protease